MAGTEGSWSVASNCRVSHGSLENFITFKSPATSTEEDGGQMHSRDLLVLNPDSPDSNTCDITVIFQQAHEVDRIHVKCTAPTVEVYYLTDKEDDKVYFRHAQCRLAAKEDGEVKDCVPKPESSERKEKSDDKNIGSEDNLLEDVMILESSLHRDSENPTTRETCGKIDSSKLDFYEATLETTDAGPCVAMTLRFSSPLMEALHVEEISIYAHQTKGTGRAQEEKISDSLDNSKLKGGSSAATLPNEMENTMKQGHSCGIIDAPQEEHENTQAGGDQEVPELVPRANRYAFGGVETLLLQLVSRLHRIEAAASDFEQRLDDLARSMPQASAPVTSAMTVAAEFNALESFKKNRSTERPDSER